MARKRNPASRVASSRVADDLKLINGIGPVFEKKLHKAGIRTFAQLAKKSPAEVATHIPNISARQIRAQGWIRQARKVESRKAGSRSRDNEATGLPSSQHYENFTLEFLLTEKNKIRRLRIVHVQSGDVDSWTKWNPVEVSSFLERHTKARFPRRKTQKQIKRDGKQKTIVETPKPVEPVKQETQKRKYLAPITFIPAGKAPHPKKSRKPDTQPVSMDPKDQMGKVRLSKWIISMTGSSQPVLTLPHNETFDVSLTLDISKLALSRKAKLGITGRVFAKKLGSKFRQVIGEAETIVPYSPIINLSIGKAVLGQGLYRLEAQIKLNESETVSLPKSINTSLQGGLFQVY